MEEKLSDRNLLKIAMIVGFIGLLSLFLIMFFYEEPLIGITDVQDKEDEGQVKVDGFLEKLSYSKDNKTTFITLSQKCYIDVVSFDYIYFDNVSLKNITVEGTVSVEDYNGKIKRSIIADSIQINS